MEAEERPLMPRMVAAAAAVAAVLEQLPKCYQSGHFPKWKFHFLLAATGIQTLANRLGESGNLFLKRKKLHASSTSPTNCTHAYV